MRELQLDQLNACLVVIGVPSRRYPIRFFAGYGKKRLIKTAWSMAGAQLLTRDAAEAVLLDCSVKKRPAHIFDLRGGAA